MMKCSENRITVIGILDKEAKFSHKFDSYKFFYKVDIVTKRLNDTKDTLPIMITNDMLDMSWLGTKCKIEGTIRTYNKKTNDKNNLILYIFAEKITPMRMETQDTDECVLSGFICKNPLYRLTPLKKEITDIILAVNRSYGKSDYIPCICWGSSARGSANLKTGSEVLVYGRLQSREYIKRNEVDGETIKTTYEVSIQKIEIISCDKVS